MLGRTLDELPPQTRKLLIALQGWIKGRADTEDVQIRDIRFRRREARDELGWSDTPLKVHLNRLVEMEYLVLHRASGLGGTVFEYQLAHEQMAGGALDLRMPVPETGPESAPP